MENMDDGISKDEIESYVKHLKTGNTAGRDEILYEFYKEGGPGIIGGVYELFKKIWSVGRVPRSWNERVILIHKGGHKSKKDLRNYRPIAPTDTIFKIFCGELSEELGQIFERCKVMDEEQNEFRRNRRGEDIMYLVNELIESKDE